MEHKGLSSQAGYATRIPLPQTPKGRVGIPMLGPPTQNPH